eukprot:3006650-Rhodomonas_salina.1
MRLFTPNPTRLTTSTTVDSAANVFGLELEASGMEYAELRSRSPNLLPKFPAAEQLGPLFLKQRRSRSRAGRGA